MTTEHSTDPQPSIWQTVFTDEDRQAQLADDSLAWNRVAGSAAGRGRRRPDPGRTRRHSGRLGVCRGEE
jgi:hypothetical protein